ncbi:vanin-like protein 2 [Orussus abietinus]|uniref:vanin-like protein 2 n=1 Tax=Orussus abietinus TaxID=222816 RepID=UPI0006267AC0|nr:vanin-like protein 2 [Orussus abietinus]
MQSSLLQVSLGLLMLVRITLQASSATSSHYTGAVVEYYPVRGQFKETDSGTRIANENAKNFETILKKATEYAVDIIVFPENSLLAGFVFSFTNRSHYPEFSSFLPDPKDSVTPCENSTSNVMEAVKTISCAAKRYSIYVVMNIPEKQNCTGIENCPYDGYFFYNTNIAFNRQGAIVARYRKYDLYAEPGFDRPPKPEISTFLTDFNVTFGQLSCLDILFQDPALRLVRDLKVTNVLVPTHRYTELPFLATIPTQLAWSYVNDVNLLSAGYNLPVSLRPSGSGGSGIYAGKRGGILAITRSDAPRNILLVAKISKDIRSPAVKDYGSHVETYVFKTSEISTTVKIEEIRWQGLVREDLSQYTTRAMVPGNETYNQTLCNRGLCCDFFVRVNYNSEVIRKPNVNYYRYRFAVFNGVRKLTGFTSAGVEVCGIISCTNDTQDSCRFTFTKNATVVHPVTFESVVVSGNFSTGPDVLRLPITLTTDVVPLNISDFSFASKDANDTHANVAFSLVRPQKRLMTFAVYGRNFAADGKDITSGASMVILLDQLALILINLTLLFSGIVRI